VQMNAIRSLHVPGVSTTAFTAGYIELVSGLALWSLTAHSVRRLTTTMICLAAGALFGDWMLGHAHLYAPVVPVLVTAVVIVIASVALKPLTRSGMPLLWPQMPRRYRLRRAGHTEVRRPPGHRDLPDALGSRRGKGPERSVHPENAADSDARQPRLGHEPCCRALGDQVRVICRGICGSHDQRGRVVVVGQPTSHIKTRLLAQADIDQHDIRAQGRGTHDRLCAITGRPSDGYSVSLEHGKRRCDERFVVINDHTP
jgi:hypothetical protein